MKVDWDRIIKEDHKPSRASRRLVGGYGNSNASKEEQIKEYIGLDEYLLPLSLIGGPAGLALGLGTYAASKITTAVLKEQQRKIDYEAWMSQLVSPNEENMRKNWGFYDDLYNKTKQTKWKMMRDDIGRQLESEFGYNVFAQKNQLPAVNPVEEAAKEAKEQEEYRAITQENEAYMAQLRNEATRKAEAERALVRSQAMTAQKMTALEAAKNSATTMRGALGQLQASAQATAAARSQNLKSLQELATQRSAVASAEAAASQAIKANSAQILSQQDALRTKLRNEALAKQAAIGTVPSRSSAKVLAPQVKVLAPQVRVGGSKASGYIRKLIAMYKDGLEVFDIKKMKWASDNLKALGIMVEELPAESPAEFPMGRNGLKENREGKVEQKMENLPTYRELEKTKEKYIHYTEGKHTTADGKTLSPKEYRIRMETKGYRFLIDNDAPVPEGSELDGRKGYDKRRLKILPEVEALPIRPAKK